MENFELVVEELREKADQAESRGEKKLRQRFNYTASIFEELDQRRIDPTPFDSHLKTLKGHLENPKVKPAKITAYYSSLLQFIEKEYHLVTDKYYQNQWLAIGMAVFGMPFGLMFGMALDNLAFLGIGLPIGMSIGIAIGQQKDRKAKSEGRQLAVSCDI